MEKVNEKELEKINGGAALTEADIPDYFTGDASTIYAYGVGQKVRFRNPNNTEEELIGIIQSIMYEGAAISYRIVVCNSEMEAEHLSGRPYKVPLANIVGLA